MTREHVPNEAAPDPAEGGVEGERGISSITSPGSSRLNDKNKKALVAAGHRPEEARELLWEVVQAWPLLLA